MQTLTVIYCDQDRCVMKLFNLEMDSTMFKSGVFLTKFGHKLLLFYLLSLILCESVEKIARTLCFMHQGIVRPSYIFYNDAYFLDFCAQKFPLTFFLI